MRFNKLFSIVLSLIILFAFTSCNQKIEKDTMSYDVAYNEFLNSNKWRKINLYNEGESEINSVEIVAQKIFDFDDNGIPELWFVAKTPGNKDSSKGEEISGFCTIDNNKVKILLKGYISGGTIGGETINILYDKEMSQHVIALIGYSRGFNGNMAWGEYYSLNNGLFDKVAQISQISQVGNQYEDIELQDPKLYYVEKESPLESSDDEKYITVYKVNEKQVSIEEFNQIKSRFVLPENEKFILQKI